MKLAFKNNPFKLARYYKIDTAHLSDGTKILYMHYTDGTVQVLQMR